MYIILRFYSMDMENKGEMTQNFRFIIFEDQYIFLIAVRAEGRKNGCRRWQTWALKILTSMKRTSSSIFVTSQTPSIIIFFCHHSNTAAFPQLSYKLSWMTSPILHRYHPIKWWWLPNLYPQFISQGQSYISYHLLDIPTNAMPYVQNQTQDPDPHI